MSMIIRTLKPVDRIVKDDDYIINLPYVPSFHKSFRRLKDSCDNMLEYNGRIYFPYIHCPYCYIQGWFMKSGWYKHKNTEYIARDLEGFKRYCKKYMKLKGKNDAIFAYRYVLKNYREGDIIEIAW